MEQISFWSAPTLSIPERNHQTLVRRLVYRENQVHMADYMENEVMLKYFGMKITKPKPHLQKN